MSKPCKVIAIANQKGGVGKTITSISLGVALAQLSKKTLLIDFDPQGNLTKSLGYRDSRSYTHSLKDAFMDEINEQAMNWKDYIIHSNEKVDIIPANISLSGTDLALSSAMSRECILKRFIDSFKDNYEYILVDCNPALNLFTINALTASNSVLIPVQAEPYAIDGLSDLLHTIRNVKRQLNPMLNIEGILITMTDDRTNLSKHIANEVHENFGDKIHIFKNNIPRCIATAEASLRGESPIQYCPKADSTRAYIELAKEVDRLNGKTVTKNKSEHLR